MELSATKPALDPYAIRETTQPQLKFDNRIRKDQTRAWLPNLRCVLWMDVIILFRGGGYVIYIHLMKPREEYVYDANSQPVVWVNIIYHDRKLVSAGCNT